MSFSSFRDAGGSWQRAIGSSLRVQPSNRLQANVSANYTFARDVAQWVKNADLDTDGVDEHFSAFRDLGTGFTAPGTPSWRN
jgi:hypothetical protein